MKAFCIYFYQGNITFKNIINLISFIINLVEYLVISSYSVTVLDNFRKETSDRAKKDFLGEVFNSLTFMVLSIKGRNKMLFFPVFLFPLS